MLPKHRRDAIGYNWQFILGPDNMVESFPHIQTIPEWDKAHVSPPLFITAAAIASSPWPTCSHNCFPPLSHSQFENIPPPSPSLFLSVSRGAREKVRFKKTTPDYSLLFLICLMCETGKTRYNTQHVFLVLFVQ